MAIVNEASATMDDSMKPTQYTGPLTAADVINGKKACLTQARRLLDDAKILHDAGSHATAAALASLSTEESVKSLMLLQIAAAAADNDRVSAWRSLRNHGEKSVYLRLVNLIITDAIQPDGVEFNLSRCLMEWGQECQNRQNREYLCTIKELGIYADCYGGETPEWTTPTNAINSSVADTYINMAEATYQLVSANCLPTQMEVESECIEIMKSMKTNPGTEPSEIRRSIEEWLYRLMDLANKQFGVRLTFK